MGTQPGMEDIMHAVHLLQTGDRDGARSRLLNLWEEWSGRPAAIQRSVIAHFLADTEQHVQDELRWDLLSLEAATSGGEVEDRHPSLPSLQAFLPSIHLNVGDAYRRSGDLPRALTHAGIGLACVGALEPGGYRDMVAAGLERLRARVQVADADS